ncbi:MAG: selenide, water dikinase SelD [Spirochaetia bacterium]|nr:selenide, water dikinase SelD [Spirochaetia bacterium]
MTEVQLTQFSSASGCGCKIDAVRLKNILSIPDKGILPDKNLFVGNDNNEDAAAYFIDDQNLLLSTIDFFTPVVDDAYEFGFIAAANAMSDIFAMGGTPVFALSVLGWPLKDLSDEVARRVVSGATDACASVNIRIAGGHSIENREPVFGLSVNGLVKRNHIKLNKGARPGDLIFLTKPLGAGILTTAIKRKIILENDYKILLKSLKRINTIGADFGKINGINAMTDVTGFGFAGHLIEVCKGSGVTARLFADKLPRLLDLQPYIDKESLPGGLHKNWKNYSGEISPDLHAHREMLADPQTNGGLLVAVAPSAVQETTRVMQDYGIPFIEPVGEMAKKGENGYCLF